MWLGRRPDRHLVGDARRPRVDQPDRVRVDLGERVRGVRAAEQADEERGQPAEDEHRRGGRADPVPLPQACAPDGRLCGLLELVLAPAVRGRRLCRPQCRELGRQALDVELVDVLRPVEVLEAMLPEVADPDLRELVVLEHRAGRLRHEDLAAVPGRHDPRRAVNAEAVVPLVADAGLARVDPHPHPAVRARPARDARRARAEPRLPPAPRRRPGETRRRRRPPECRPPARRAPRTRRAGSAGGRPAAARTAPGAAASAGASTPRRR